MSIRCRDIMALPGLSLMRLVGGAQGLDRTIRWIYFGDAVDDMNESPQWINGHEIVLYSGTAYSGSPKKLVQAIHKLNDMEIAGLIINVGPYIQDIPEEVIGAADELELPLFRLPWEVKLVNVTHAICNAIISGELQESRASSMLDAFLTGSLNNSQDFAEILTKSKLSTEKGCIVGLCEVRNPELMKSNTSENAMEKNKALQNRLDDSFTYNGVRAITTISDNNVVFLVPNQQNIDQKLQRILKDTECRLYAKYPGIQIHAGISTSSNISSDIRKSFVHARQALISSRIRKDNNNLASYDELGVMSILFAIEDESVLRSYFVRTLGALIEYDKISKSSLYRTLEAYYKNNKNIQETAQVLYIHRNTLKYRLERISEILNCDIHQHESFIEVGVGIMIGQILNDS